MKINNMTLTFRVAKLEEKNEVLAKIREFWEEPVEWDTDEKHMAEIFDEKVYDCSKWKTNNGDDEMDTHSTKYPLIFLRDDLMIGFCHIQHDPSKDDVYEWIILDFAIFNPFRQKGYGSKFVGHIIDFCRIKTINKPCQIEASSDVDNTVGSLFWRRCGFETVEQSVGFSERHWIGLFDVNVYKDKKTI
jgi:predicted acetyltransferase